MRLGAIALAVGLVACESPVAPPPTQTAAQTAVQESVALPTISLPAQRLALPLDVVRMRLPQAAPIGTVSGVDFEQSVPLRALGINVCQTGWFVQGYIEHAGELQSTPGFLLELAEVPTGPFTYHVPGVQGSHLAMDFESFSLENAKGKIAVINDSGETTFDMTFDGVPISVPAQPHFGAQGCYTTGFFKLGEQQGPATAVFDGRDLFYVGLRLTDRHSIAFMLSLRADLRKPGNLIVGDLARVDADPQKFGFRVFAETRRNRPGVANQPLLEAEQTPIVSGTVRASFATTEAKGPLRLELRDIVLPNWDGPYAGMTLPRVQVEVLFVTDVESGIVPVPSSPQWGEVAP